ncbi:MAG: hypothetical protein AAF471_06485, partial [Myxococcota bacterium]
GSVRFFVGLSFLSRFEADHPLSFLRKQESTEKVPKSGSNGFLEGPESRNPLSDIRPSVPIL